MKKQKWTVWLLFAAFLLSGCSFFPQTIQKPVSFYYISAEPEYGSETGYICPEARETAGILSEQEILSVYLAGPISEELISPFPEGSTILQLYNAGSITNISLSPHFKELKGIKLITAGGCFAKTVMELTGCDTVIFTVEGGFEDISGPLTFRKNDMIFSDFEHAS